MSEPEDQAQIARELAEELRRLKVEDVLIQTLITVSALGYRRLGLTPETKDDRDLAQAKLAIETMNALTPVLEQVVPAELSATSSSPSRASSSPTPRRPSGEGADGEG